MLSTEVINSTLRSLWLQWAQVSYQDEGVGLPPWLQGRGLWRALMAALDAEDMSTAWLYHVVLPVALAEGWGPCPEALWPWMVAQHKVEAASIMSSHEAMLNVVHPTSMAAPPSGGSQRWLVVAAITEYWSDEPELEREWWRRLITPRLPELEATLPVFHAHVWWTDIVGPVAIRCGWRIGSVHGELASTLA